MAIADGAILSLNGALSTGVFSDTRSLTGGATLVVTGVEGEIENTSGTFSPADGPAAVNFEGHYVQLSGGTLALEIAGTTPGTEFDVLSIEGDMNLAGTVEVTLLDGFEPAVGDTLTLINATVLTNSGITFSLPALSAGKAWESSLTSQAITLTVATDDSLVAFRALYGLAEDGSDDNTVWSNDVVADIFYYAFGLGDPNDSDIDRTRLPGIGTGTAADTLTFAFVRPHGTGTGLQIEILTSNDLSTWSTPDDLGTDYLPASEETEDLGDGYERVTQTCNLIPGEDGRFYKVGATESSF